MIELAFGEGPAGALKLAKSMKYGDQYINTNVVARGTGNDQHETELSRYWSGITMEGSFRDVEALTLALDIGDISDMDTDMNQRKKLLDTLFADFPGVSDEIWATDQHALASVLIEIQPLKVIL